MIYAVAENQFFNNLDMILDTDLGELKLELFGDEEKKESIFSITCKLPKGEKRKEIYILPFIMDNHPETHEREDFTIQLININYRWVAYIFPQYGKGTITNKSISVKKVGTNEFFNTNI